MLDLFKLEQGAIQSQAAPNTASDGAASAASERAAAAAPADFDDGLAAFEAGDYATDFKEWRPLAEQDHAPHSRHTLFDLPCLNFWRQLL